jgi:3-oxoacyl-(acyl-carrier-protein) synthase
MHASGRIVITGIGVVAPGALGHEMFWEGCRKGAAVLRPITLFDVDRAVFPVAGEIRDFDPARHLGTKGLRNLDRTTLLALVAARLALADAGFGPDADGRAMGVVLGSTMGSVRSIAEFDRVGLCRGPRAVNPALFPNTVINAPASQVGIRFHLCALNATIGTGFTASLDAVAYALDMLALGRARMLLVGGVEELSREMLLGFRATGLLVSGGRRGVVVGEGAALFVLEPLAEARRRRAPIYAEILGCGRAFTGAWANGHGVERVARTVASALAEAGLPREAIGYVGSGANGTRTDERERMALGQVFGEGAGALPTEAVKLRLGESFSAGGALQLAAALRVLAPEASPRAGAALVTAVAPTGHTSVVVLGSPEEARS